MANIYSVSTAEELMSALASAKGGDTIELAGGDYGKLELNEHFHDFIRYDSPVTITSADPNASARFTKMVIHGGSNITIDNVVFDYEFSSGDNQFERPFEVNNSEYITIRESVFLGDVADGVSDVLDGFGYGYGLSVRSGQNIVIENNEFMTWTLGAVFRDIEGLTVSQNEFHDMQRDGTNFVDVQSVLIEDNYFHSFRNHPDSTEHRDFIQFFTRGTDQPSTDVVIRGNILDIGEGPYTQSIFMRNEEVDSGNAGSEMYYQNILIENNTIHNAQSHGITVGEADGLTIRYNSILRAEGEMYGQEGAVTVPRINVIPESKSVVIEGNITSAINGYEAQPDWDVSGNALIQPADYLKNFVTSSLDPVGGAHNYIALPDSLIETLQAGAARTQFDNAPDTLTPQFQVYLDASSSQTLIFDASLTTGSLGLVLEDDAEFLWSFGDGSSAVGRIVKQEFAAPGYYDVTLTVVAKDATAQAQFSAGVAGSDIAQFDMQTGQFKAWAYGEEKGFDSIEGSVLQTAEGYALKLGGEGTQASVPKSELSRFFGTEAFELSMSVKADSPASLGEIARLHTSFITRVDKSGNFVLNLFLDDGSRVDVVSEGVVMNDGDVHDVTIRFDGGAGFAEIVIDNQVVASEDVSGALGGDMLRPLRFGNPWGGQNFDGELSAFALSTASREFPIYDGSAEVISDTSGAAAKVIAPEADTTTDSESLPGEDSGTLEPLLRGGYELDFADIPNSDTVRLHDDAYIVDTQDGQALSFDGKKDYVSLGRLAELEDSQKIAFSVDFRSDSANGGNGKLVSNHSKLGLTVEGDGIRVLVANNDAKYWQGFQIKGLGLNDGNPHSATVMVDAEADRLQVVVDDVLVLDEQNTDLDFVGAGGHEWGWTLGIPWNNWFEGEVYDFQVSDDFTFIGPVTEDGTILA